MKTEMVSNWMNYDVITITPNTRLIDAHDILRKYNIRRLPVVDIDGKLIGIVTLGDIREASPSDATTLSVWELNYLLARLQIQEVMTPNPITVYTSDTIAEAAKLMLENKVSGLPVLDPVTGTLKGIITESDIFRLVTQTWEDIKPKVSVVMDR